MEHTTTTTQQDEVKQVCDKLQGLCADWKKDLADRLFVSVDKVYRIQFGILKNKKQVNDFIQHGRQLIEIYTNK